MLRKIRFIFIYFLLWIIFFEISRLAFLLYNHRDSIKLARATWIQTFFSGLRMDISMAGYLTIPVCFFLLIAVLTRSFSTPKLYKAFTGIGLFAVLLIIFCDLPAYEAWGRRLDSVPLKYLASPGEAWASVSHLPVLWMIIFFALTFIFIYKVFAYVIEKKLGTQQIKEKKITRLLSLCLVIGLLIITIRGGLQLAPLNQSSVYFSKNNFANLAAINAPWNFMHSLLHNAGSTNNPFAYLDSNVAGRITADLLSQPGETEKFINLQTTPKPNIILVIWESFKEKASHMKREAVEITPGFNKLKQEGIYFSNIYASGDRTDKGIVALLSGYPAQPITSIIKIPQKAGRLPRLPALFADSGYNTSFYYGGELEFANMKAYLLASGFQQFTSINDFKKEDRNSKWGAHDHVVKDKVLRDLSTTQQPFFKTWLTLSSHEPFETPVRRVINGTDKDSRFLNSIHYTDSTIFDFVQHCKQLPSWKSTILIIIADHGHRLLGTGKVIHDYKIPMLFLGGALTRTGINKDKTGSQVDLPATLLQQIGWEPDAFTWSKNLLKSETQGWAYFAFNNGFGFIIDDRYFIYDNVGKLNIEQAGKITRTDLIKGKAIQQMSFKDYLEK